MFTIILQEKGGEQRRMVFNKPEVTIGRVQGNDIVLPKGNVSKRHARIVLKDGKFIIVDLKSTNGTYVNGRKITSPLVVKDSDKIYIGDFIVGVDEATSGEGESQSETTTSPPGGDRIPDMPPPGPMGMPGGMGARPARGQPTEAVQMPPPEPAPAPAAIQQTLRPNPPRPPGPSRDLAPPREPLGPPGPLGGPSAIPPLGGGGPMPPSELRTRPPIGGRPGGTMPPPVQPNIPAPHPQPPPPAPTMMEPPAPMPAPAPMPMPMPMQPPSAPIPAPAQQSRPMQMPAPMPAPQMMNAEPAPVVPLAQKQPNRSLAGVGARKVVGRAVSAPSRRGVQLEPLDPKLVKMLDLQSNILDRLRQKLDLDKIPMERLHEEDLWQRAERATIDLVETLETSGELPKYIDQDTLIKETLNEALALGPLEDLLADDKIDEIVIDRRDRVVVGKDGQLRGSGKAFSSDEVFERVVKRLVAEAGSKIDDANPLVDLRMRDGTRLTAAVSPVAARGACLVLRKNPAAMPQLADLVGQGTLSNQMADFLATCIAARRNILVCGGASSGKTTIVGALASAAPVGERVVSIEEVGELSLARDEWVQLETRATGGGRAAVIDLASLLETALRLAPDRLVVGEVRGREALPLVCALDASVDGAIVGMTGEGANGALGRLTTLCRATGHAAPNADAALRDLVAQAFEIVIHVVRFADGTVRVAGIEEVVGSSEAGFETHVLFQQKDGGFAATGTVPRFYGELEARGIPADQAVFRS